MSSLTVPRPRVKPSRNIRIKVRSPSGEAVLRITVGKKPAHYFVTPLRADFGSAYELRKIGPNGFEPVGYHVNLNGQQSSCECRGFLQHGHCKHVSGLAVLQACGLI
jgi:hypothetical protein